jgi:hypothetical protein
MGIGAGEAGGYCTYSGHADPEPGRDRFKPTTATGLSNSRCDASVEDSKNELDTACIIDWRWHSVRWLSRPGCADWPHLNIDGP